MFPAGGHLGWSADPPDTIFKVTIQGQL